MQRRKANKEWQCYAGRVNIVRVEYFERVYVVRALNSSEVRVPGDIESTLPDVTMETDFCFKQ